MPACCLCNHALAPLGLRTRHRRHMQVAIPVVTASELEEILFGNAKSCEQLATLMKAQRRELSSASWQRVCSSDMPSA